MKAYLRLAPLLVLTLPQLLAQSSPNLGATQNADLQDSNGDGAANRGERINYEVDITNSGAGDATSVNLSETIDSNTTLVPGSVMVGPVGIDDAYDVTGNVAIQVPANAGVLANDIDPDGGASPALTALALDTTGTQGTVNLQSDGSFTYTPPAGFNGSDSFTYTTRDASSIDSAQPGLVTLTVSNAVWFIDATDTTADDATAGNAGNPFNPFNTIAAFNAANTGAPGSPSIADGIHLATGSYANGITLLPAQKLIGQGVALNSANLGFTLASHSVVPTPGVRPLIESGAGHVVQLASANTVRGLNIGNTPPNTSGLSGGSIGGLILSDLSVSGSGGILNIADGALVTSNVGPLVSTGSALAPAFAISTVDLAAAPSFGPITISGASSGGISLTDIPANGGSLSLGPVNLSTNNSTGFLARNAAVLNISGTGSTINSIGGSALDFQSLTLGTPWNLASLTSTASSGNGIRLNQTIGDLSVSGTTTVTNSTGTGIELNTAAGSHQFGTLDLTGTTQTGLFATNSGTVSATGGTFSTGIGTAIDINNTNLGLTLTSVSVNGASNGIDLTNTTGSLSIAGSGSAVGAGGSILNTNGDGVLLNNATNISLNGISMTGTTRNAIRGRNVTNLTVTNSSFSNIGTTGVAPLGEVHAFDFNSGDSSASAGVTGTLLFENVSLTTFIDTGLFIHNETGSLTATVQGNSQFNDNHDVVGRFAINVEANASAAVALTIDGVQFDNIESSVLRFEHDSNQASSFNFDNNLSTNGGGPDDFPNGGGVEAVASGTGNLDFNIRGNTITDLPGDAFNLVGAFNTAQEVVATIGGTGAGEANTISGGNVSLGDGIQITKESGGSWDIRIENNQIGTDTMFPGLGDDGIQIINRDNGGGLILGIIGNTIEGTTSEAIRFFSDEDTGGATGNPKNQLTIRGNSLANIGDPQWIELRTANTANACYYVDTNNFNSAGEINIDIAAPSTASISQASLMDLETDNPGATAIVSDQAPDFNSGGCALPLTP